MFVLVVVEVAKAVHEDKIEIWEVGAKEDETKQGEARCASKNKKEFDGGGQGRVCKQEQNMNSKRFMRTRAEGD